ncbi:uncharacterized protein LOC119466233 isoform X5 [Dermacentor silvarum]|uniref:uncharacterized protein LOC119466233 isoform X5 n=1 Tax=Dermacentor silvarum TaxID=543639 RepID=UPI002101CCC8|nr:uncharacterized protein LOC119466233 isoform X5 [Dermacentor silvarum]
MKHQVVAVFLVLCFTSAVVNANAAVDAVIEQLKDFVRHFEKDQDKAQETLSKIDRARECLSAAKDINPDIINRVANGVIQTLMECGGKHISSEDPQERKTVIKNCLLEKANKFEESSGMTPEDSKMFNDALACIQKVAED